ncbi:P1 family peptidase [Candidatus Zixiibacteriota bacterium]
MIMLCPSILLAQGPDEARRPRTRDIGIEIGRYPTGPENTITDVPGVLVGHVTLIEGTDIRTGVTAIVPHGGNLFFEKVPAALFVGNGFGKLAGATQIEELGTIETPILLCGTLNVPRVADALLSWMLALPGMENVRSINPVVGETNDGGLNDIRGRHIGNEEVFAAIRSAVTGPVAEGSVGAGTGTRALGFKGGIGTSSRQVNIYNAGTFTVGVLVQSNFGGTLRVNGSPVGREIQRLMREREPDIELDDSPDEGSCMIIVATDAPLETRNLKRLAFRALGGMARVGANFSNGSGDYVLAFSSAEEVRVDGQRDDMLREGPYLGNTAMSGLFTAVMDATEEAILNSLLQATDCTGQNGATSRAVPIDLLLEVCRQYRIIPPGS